MVNFNDEKVIGIVGGMGPRAGLALLDRILHHTNALNDQEHLSTILMSFPGRIVDRTAFLDGEEPENPAYCIAEIVHRLEHAGAGVVGIACNTSHCPRIFDVIIEELQKRNSRVQLLNMITEVCKAIHTQYPVAKRIGLMATNGTYRSGVYEHLLHKYGLEVVLPDHNFQNSVIHRMIYDPDFGLKATSGKLDREMTLLLKHAFLYFKEKKVDALVFGCTEFSLLPPANRPDDMPIIDSTQTLAAALIREVMNGQPDTNARSFQNEPALSEIPQ